MCGCGQPAAIAKWSDASRGRVGGKPTRFAYQHGTRKYSNPYVEDPDSGCWIWQGTKTPRGYGTCQRNGKGVYAHRLYWEQANGPIPDGLTIDHLCNNPSCVNPDHIALATQYDNMMRGSGPSAVNARKTHCVRGHEFTPDNTYISKTGKRRCRACGAEDHRRKREERRQK